MSPLTRLAPGPLQPAGPTERHLLPAVMRNSMSEPGFNLDSLHPISVATSGAPALAPMAPSSGAASAARLPGVLRGDALVRARE